MDLEQVLILVSAALAAGWIDAVVGGGGLLLLPALMVTAPGLPVATVLGTNKLAAIMGTSSAAVTYSRHTRPDGRVTLPAALLAVAGAGAGAACASMISSDMLRPIVMIGLTAVAVFVAVRPQFGAAAHADLATRRRMVLAVLLTGGVIGFYDGILGPGTGTFLIIAFTLVMGLDFVHASASAKIVNTGTNLGALLVFGLQGHVLWQLGLLMGVANIVGAQIGARMAIRRGSAFVRVVLLVVVVALVLRLGYDQFMAG
ncbi:TSUP family transporter [Allonocardiopsis opalescens]|uniref:Probable membrane transporter protein n=1 Tax=Allonocardiopsis opalescens TaxID=1144618 RepID=A0A2T0PM97_9ACTN|nr:TSUP family transporter [Allonocardiopsis opalescens]PRX90024.1 hypothetical protein CLV72_11914 [Allonocardiopsis opalescens]